VRAALALATLLAAAPAKAAEGHLLVVAGLGGDPQHRDLFHEQAVALATAAETRLGLLHDNVACLTENPERDPSTIDGRSSLENVGAEFAKLKARVRPGDRVFLVLTGTAASRRGGPSTFRDPTSRRAPRSGSPSMTRSLSWSAPRAPAAPSPRRS
jgi:hypothetical protein